MDQDLRDICAERFASDPRISDVASFIIVAAQTDIVVSEEDVYRAAERLTIFAEEHGLQPEDVQAAIFHNEPALRYLDN